MMGYEIAVDVGGTFTDLVIKDGQGGVRAFKSPTTPDNIVDGTLNAVSLAAAALGTTRAEIMANCRKFAFGTTAATNAVLEGKGARTGLLCTKGHRDVLLIREGGKEDTYTIDIDYPPPYIPRSLTLEIDERIDAEGGVVVPLDEAGARDAIRHLIDEKVEAIAVAFLWSIANPAHERRVAELIEEMAPGLAYSVSHVVSPSVREYRRTSATALDASLSMGQKLLLATMSRLAPGTAVRNGLDASKISHDPAVVRAYREDPLVHDRITARLARFIVDGARDAIERASALAVPTLLLVAGDDRLVPITGIHRFAQRAPRELLDERVYDGLWHELFNESEPARGRVFAELGAWLDARPLRAGGGPRG